MSDIFRDFERKDIFRPRLPERPGDYRPDIQLTPNGKTTDQKAEDLFKSWSEAALQKKDFQEQSAASGVRLSQRYYDGLYDLREHGLIDDDDIYKVAFAKEMAEYTGLEPSYVMANYDEMWKIISGDIENRYALPQSRLKALQSSLQIMKNNAPLGKLGQELMNLPDRLTEAHKAKNVRADKITAFEALKESDTKRLELWEHLTQEEKNLVNLKHYREKDLWKQITSLREANEKLSRGMPTDPLSFIVNTTIQSAPATGKALAGGAIGGAALGLASGGTLTGLGASLGSFASSSSEMIGLMYIDLLAAGVEKENAKGLALVGGSLQGFIEVGLGTIPGIGRAAGKLLPKTVVSGIAENASKKFIKRISETGIAASLGKNVLAKTAVEFTKQAGEEGLEEVLQLLVEQAMFSIADAMQDAPVDRDAWGSPEFWSEMKQSLLGGIAGGIGFGIAGLPLSITGNVRETARQTAQLNNLAANIDDKAEFRAAVKDHPMVKGLSEAQIDQIHESQSTARQEEAKRTEELRTRRLYGAMDISGDVYRTEDGRYYMEHNRHTESGGRVTGEIRVGDPHKGERNSYAVGRYELRGESPVFTEFKVGEKYESLRGNILQNFANDIGKDFDYEGEHYSPIGEGYAQRFGWSRETQARPMGESGQFDFNRPYYSSPDTQADIEAKQNFARQIKSLDTLLKGEEAAQVIVDVYDTVGRKWFNSGFDSFMNRITGGNLEGFFTQKLDDAQVARWIANKEGVVSDAAAVKRIEENLTDTQREEARQNIHGFMIPGSEGITKAIYAAKDADVSTFIHEGIHAFTQLAKSLDPELHSEMMKAAGFDQKAYDQADAAGREAMMRNAMETLAYGAEAYLQKGPQSVNDSALAKLYERIKEFLKDLKDALQKSKYLTSEVEALFDKLFGEQTVERKGAENVPKTGQNVTKTEINVPKEAGNVIQKAESVPEEFEIYSDSLDRDIKNENLSIEKRSEAVAQKAGQEYFQQIIEETNSRFNEELEKFLEGKIEKGHIFKLGLPGWILRRAGIPAEQEIELTAEQLKKKSTSKKHPFDPKELSNFAKLINEPVAVFSYAKKADARNVIISTKQKEKNFLVGIHFDSRLQELTVSEIRGLYPKDTTKWLNWINQGKLHYANIEKLQAVVTQLQPNAVGMSLHNLEQQAPEEDTQQRTNPADVNSRLNMEPIKKLLQDHADVKHYYPEDENIYFQAAYHGSPYRFERFDSSHMGEGEGAQAYGWGHYFASKREVAEWYREELSAPEYYDGDKKLSGEESWAASFLFLYKDIDGFIRLTRNEAVEKVRQVFKPEVQEKFIELIDKLDSKGLRVEEGTLYEVDIPGDEEMLDWDKPLTEQSDNIKRALQNDINERQETLEKVRAKANSDYHSSYKDITTGEYFYSFLKAKYKSDKAASKYLNSLEIKGIRYLDGSSRADGEGSYNYVIFDDDDIDITQTFYSEAFQDEGLAEFINNYPEVVKEAAGFETGADMAAHYADYNTMPNEVFRKAKALGYFDALARAAKSGDAGSATNFISGVSVEKASAALAAYGAGAEHALEAARLVRGADDWTAAVELLEQQGVPRIDAETYADTARSFSHSDWLWLEKAAEAKEKPSARENVKIGEEPTEAMKRFFNAFVDGAKEIYPEENLEALRAELAGEPRTAEAFVNMINTDEGFNELLEYVNSIIKEGHVQGETDEETRQNEAVYNRVLTTFNTTNPNWDTALKSTAAGSEVEDRTKKIIRGMIRNRPLQYMEAWAMMTGDETWLPAENDIQRIKRLDTEGLADEDYLESSSPEEIERIGRRLSSDRVKKKIDNKTLQFEDPDLTAYEEQLKEDVAKAKKLIEERGEGFKDFQWMLEMLKRNARKEQILWEQQAADTSNAGLKAKREQAKKLSKAYQQVSNVAAQLESFAREDLTPTQRTAFLELRKAYREQERLQAELAAIGQLREIKKRDIKQILRKPDLKTVSVTEAAKIEWIQAHFDSYEAIARFIGKGAKDIRELYNQFATDAEYRATLKKKLNVLAYNTIEHIVFKNPPKGEVRAYTEISAQQRRTLYKNLLEYEDIFQDMGIDITEEPRKYSKEEWSALRKEMQDYIPADLLYKLEGLLERDEQRNRRFKVDNFNIEDIQTLAGIVNRLRKEGREREEARKDARSELRKEEQVKIRRVIEEHMPKNAGGDRTRGIAETRMKEDKRAAWRGVWYSLHNARRFFRRLEGGEDGYLYNTITQREYEAFNEKNRYIQERQAMVEKQLKEKGIRLQDLGSHTFEIWNKDRVTLDEMLSFYYAQYNERALHAVIFGDYASPREREALGVMNGKDLAGQMKLESEIAERYWSDMKKLDAFFAAEGNEKFRSVMDIIGGDYDRHYGRLKDFVAREYNEVLGSEANYMPLARLGAVPQQNADVEKALSDVGLSRYINRGMTKSRVDIPSWGQQPIKAGLYALWNQTVEKQEHLMAYDPLMRELKHVFEGEGSETLRDSLSRGYSEKAVDYVKNFISEMAQTGTQQDIAALNKITRLMRGHYPAAVLGWRLAASLKQKINTPPPFFQYVNPYEYVAAGVSCLRKETRDMILSKSIYMKVRYADPSIAVVKEIQNMALQGKLGKIESALAKIEERGMYYGQQVVDMIDVYPGWLAAYNKKTAELNQSAKDSLTIQQIDAEAVRFADQVVRDCQPSAVMMDRIPLLKNRDKNPFMQIFTQFQTPAAVIFQNLFIDAPNNFKHGRYLDCFWTFGIYALIGIVIGAMKDEPEDKLEPKYRAIDAVNGWLYSVPMAGGEICSIVESYFRTGKIRPSFGGSFPVVESGKKTVNAMTDKDWGKAASNMVDALFYATGLPAASKRDFEKAIDQGKWHLVLGIK